MNHHFIQDIDSSACVACGRLESIHEEYWRRVAKLMLRPRSMTLKAAQVVVDAAMFGEGCIEDMVRAKIQAQQEAG
jgi:hypothetical protein